MEQENIKISEQLKPEESKKSSPLSQFGEGVKRLAPFAILIGVFALGFTIASNMYTSSNTNLLTDLRRSQEEYNKLKDELEKVKSEYARYLGLNEGKRQGNNQLEDAHDSEVTQNRSTNNENKAEVRIRIGDTAILFDGSLSISLVGIEFDANPSRYKLMATIATENNPELKIKNAEVGYTVTYPENKGYNIHILSIDTFSAKFLVSKIDR